MKVEQVEKLNQPIEVSPIILEEVNKSVVKTTGPIHIEEVKIIKPVPREEARAEIQQAIKTEKVTISKPPTVLTKEKPKVKSCYTWNRLWGSC